MASVCGSVGALMSPRSASVCAKRWQRALELMVRLPDKFGQPARAAAWMIASVASATIVWFSMTTE